MIWTTNETTPGSTEGELASRGSDRVRDRGELPETVFRYRGDTRPSALRICQWMVTWTSKVNLVRFASQRKKDALLWDESLGFRGLMTS